MAGTGLFQGVELVRPRPGHQGCLDDAFGPPLVSTAEHPGLPNSPGRFRTQFFSFRKGFVRVTLGLLNPGGTHEPLDRFRRLIAAASAVAVMLLAVLAMSPATDPPEHTFRIAVGLKDKGATTWSGEIAVEDGEVTTLDGWRFEGKDAVQGHSGWHCTTHEKIAPEHRFPIEGPSGRPEGKATFVPWPNGVYVTVRGTNPTVTVTITRGKTRPGRVKFKADDVPLGQPKMFLQDQVRVERLPATSVLRPPRRPRPTTPCRTITPPSGCATKPASSTWPGSPTRTEKDRVLLAERDGPDGAWSEPVEVAGPGDHFRVALAGTHDDTLWVVWSSQRNHNWDLYGRPYKDGKLGDEVRLTDDRGPDLWHRMTTDEQRPGLAGLAGRPRRPVRRLCPLRRRRRLARPSPRQHRRSQRLEPGRRLRLQRRIAYGSAGIPTIRGIQRPRPRLSGGPAPKLGDVLAPEKIAAVPRPRQPGLRPRRPALARLGRSRAELGQGLRLPLLQQPAASACTPCGASASRCLIDGQWKEPEADLYSVLPADMKEYNELPQLQDDGEGRMWLAFRHRTCRHPRIDGWAIQGRWDVFATAWLGDRWTPPVELPQSGGRNDMRVSSQRDRRATSISPTPATTAAGRRPT